jgi:single-strand DNA-binding protein
MELIGRLTKDAEVRTIGTDKEVVSFTVVQNEYSKKDGKKQTITTFFNCSYWQSSKVAEYLRKGTIVSLFGRVHSEAYIDMKGEAQSVLKFFVKNISFISGSKKLKNEISVPDSKAAVLDDLPF